MKKGDKAPGTLARRRAERRLIAAHRDEFDRFYREERIALGLPPNMTITVANAAKAVEARDREIADLREMLAQARQPVGLGSA